MECSRCAIQPLIHAFTQANLENSLGRMKTKQIIAAVNNLKTVFKGICDRCHSLPSETNKHIESLRSAWNTTFPLVEKSIEKDIADMMPAVDDLREAFQAVCLTCSRVSNDDNPSNHGQTFVSLDSGNCQANSGKAKATSTDDNIVLSRADWIGMHKSPIVPDSSFGMSPVEMLELKEDPEAAKSIENNTVSMLPPEVEDRLRHEFANFVELDIIDKLLLSCIMSGMNIAEFAKMLWFPYSIVDPKTRIVKSITKQAAHARWMNICKRFPVFMSVAISSAKDSKKAMERLKKFIGDPNGDEPEDRFQNGRLSSVYAKAAKKAREEAEQKKRKAAEEAESQERRKKRAKMLSKKKKDKLFPQGGECLPGLF